MAYVLATKVNDTVTASASASDGQDGRVDELIAALPEQAWKRISAEAGRLRYSGWRAAGRPIRRAGSGRMP
ncbi:hypothetical protein [Streptomyces sp. SCSIO 30461]|uniref:hypothetical protein n=1 Tax=Streptomyces sp. SCSIO 30461 TaxID=3118085 RepID=UPI00387E22CF